MILQFSSTITDSERKLLKPIIVFAAHSVGIDHAGLVVNLRRGKGSGAAYNLWPRKVGLRLPSDSDFPFVFKRFGIRLEMVDSFEWIVYLAGHEFGHILDYQKGRPTTEQRATWYGAAALKEFRLGRIQDD